jgi:lambda family phage minor tail protein L
MARDRTFLYQDQQQNLSGDAIIELFTINLSTAIIPADATTVPDPIYFCNWEETNGSFVAFAGNQYVPIPYQASGFAISNEGVLPNPTLTMSNVFLTPTVLANVYEDLLGTQVIRTRVLAKHLDNGSEPDSNAKWPDETWFVQRKVSENKLFITWELSTPFDLDGVTIPKRRAKFTGKSFS